MKSSFPFTPGMVWCFGFIVWLGVWGFFRGGRRYLGGYLGLIQVHSYNFVNFEKEMEDGIQYL